MDQPVRVGRSQLYAMDVVQLLRQYDGRPFDVTVTSPEYNLGKEYDGVSDSWAVDDYFDWVEMWGHHLLEQTSEYGRLCVNIPIDTFRNGHIPFASEFLTSLKIAGWHYQATHVWDKIVTTNRTSYGSWMSASAPNVVIPAELILVLYKGSWIRGKRGRTSTISRQEFMEWRSEVWRLPGESAKRRKHAAPFPEAVAERCIKLYSFLEDLIFDPFVGSGTTCAVAESLGRESVGNDLAESFITELVVPRIQSVVNLQAEAVS